VDAPAEDPAEAPGTTHGAPENLTESATRRAGTALVAAGTLLVAALALAGVAGMVRGTGSGTAYASTRAADRLAFDLPGLGGGRLTVADVRGRVTVLNIWASWCAPCREEAPALRRVASEADPTRVAFVGVAGRDEADPARGYVADFDIRYPNALDDGSVLARYNVSLLPTTMIFDRRGALVARISGVVSEVRLRSLIEDALATP
jgi:thiol-disulfide isomerase/thioredoxin